MIIIMYKKQLNLRQKKVRENGVSEDKPRFCLRIVYLCIILRFWQGTLFDNAKQKNNLSVFSVDTRGNRRKKISYIYIFSKVVRVDITLLKCCLASGHCKSTKLNHVGFESINRFFMFMDRNLISERNIKEEELYLK